MTDYIAGKLNLKKAAAPDDGRYNPDAIADGFDFQAWADDIPDGLGSIMAGVAVAAGEQQLDELGITADTINRLIRKDAEDWAKDRSAELVGMKYVNGELMQNPDAKWAITDSTRDVIRSLAAQAINDGWSSDDLAENVRDSAGFSESRAINIARTEIKFADSNGQHIAANRSEVVGGKSWEPDEEACEICQTNADQGKIGLNTEFESGDQVTPAHPRCECTILYYTKDEMNG